MLLPPSHYTIKTRQLEIIRYSHLMAEIDEQLITLETGQTICLRTAIPRDAWAVVDFRKHAAATSAFLIARPEEYHRSSWQERSHLKHVLKSSDMVYILALDQDKNIVGMITTLVRQKQRTRHVIEFGIAVHQAMRGTGVGSIMLEELIRWAETIPTLEKIELHVHANNDGAIRLYQRYGFDIEGRRRAAYKYEDGTYMDDILMGRPLSRLKDHPVRV